MGKRFSNRPSGPVRSQNEFLEVPYIILYAIISGVSQKTIKMDELVRLQNHRAKLRQIVARTTCYNVSGNEIIVSVTHRRHFGPAVPQKTLIATTFDIMTKRLEIQTLILV